MTFGRYLVGCVLLGFVFVPLGFASVLWRRVLLPGADAFESRIAEVVLSLSGFYFVAQVLGSLGQFRLGPVVAGSAVLGIAATLAAARFGGARESAERTGRAERHLATVPAVLAMAVVVALYAVVISSTLRTGPLDIDTQTYHLPMATHFFQSGWLSRLYYIHPGDPTPYHPYNGETLHALGMLVFHHDIASPFVNLGWMALALGSAWVFGRRFHAEAACVAGIAIVLTTPLLVRSQGGTAQVDVAALALFLASIALLAGDAGTRSLVVAAAAAGLALSTKLTLVVAIMSLTVVVLVLNWRRVQKKASLVSSWIIPLTVTGGFWYLRNAVRIGNPVPALNIGLGPIRLPKPPEAMVDNYGFSIVHYITDAGIWRHVFLRGFRVSFGPLWFAVLGLGLAGLLIGLVASRNRLLTGLALTGVLAGVGYIVNPLSAYGPKGTPILFAQNLRYASPVLAVGVLMVAVIWTERARSKWLPSAALGATALAVAALSPTWRGHAAVVAVAGLGSLLALAAGSYLARRGLALRVLSATLVLLLGVAGGEVVQRFYLTRRYTAAGAFLARSPWFPGVYAWAQGVDGAKIGISGFFLHYPLFGRDLTNRVTYVGRLKADKAFVDYGSCNTWRAAVNAGRFDYVVLMPESSRVTPPPQAAWARNAPALENVYTEGNASVYRVRGTLAVPCR